MFSAFSDFIAAKKLIREYAEKFDSAVSILREEPDLAAAEELAGHWCEILVSAPTVAVVEQLRAAGVGCYLASNQHAYRAAFMRRRLGYDEVFDGQLYSCDLGAMKSSRKFFSLVLEIMYPRRQSLHTPQPEMW